MMVQKARAGRHGGSGWSNEGFDVPGGRTRGGKQQPLSAIGTSMDYFLEDGLLTTDGLLP
jgi:hypothetical protein